MHRVPLSITRPVLMANCERVPLVLLMACGGTLVLAALMTWHLLPLLIGLPIMIVAPKLLRYAAGKDPYGFEVYRRHMRYRHYHRAWSTPFRVDR